MPIGNQIQYTDNVASKIVSATATASQTTFTIVGGYRVNAIAVYKQGLRLSNGVDFTATDGSTVVLTSGATLNDKMVFQIYDDFNVADISAAPGNFTVGADLSVSGTMSGDGSGLTGVGSTEDVSTSTLNVVGVATIGQDVRITRNLNAGITTFTDGYGTNLYLTNLSAPTTSTDVLLSGTLDITTGLNVRAGVSTLGTSQCDSLTVSTAGLTFSGGALADVRDVANLNVTGVSTTTKDVRAGRNFDAVGISTLTGVVNAGADVRVTRNLNVTGVSTFTGDVATSAILIPAQDVRVGRNLNVTGVSTATLDVGVGRNLNVTGITTVTQGTDLNGYKVEEGSYDSNALNGEFDFEFENGHIQTHTGSTAGTYFPDFRVSSSQSLDSVMGTGDVVSATLMVAASNTAHYCTAGVKIDNSTSNVTVEWVGSAAASAGKGAGYDIYAFTIQKTAATPAYLVIINAIDAG